MRSRSFALFLLSALLWYGCPGRAQDMANIAQDMANSAQDVTLNQAQAAAPPLFSDSRLRREIFEIDRKILLDCIKLARFSLHFHQEVNRTGFWRSWIYPIEQEAGTSLSYSNTLNDLNQRGKGLTNVARTSRPQLRRTLPAAMAGQSITATSSTIEFIHNGYIAWRASRMGFSPKQSEIYVGGLIKNIDALLAERKALLPESCELADRRYLVLQGKLLRHIRNQVLYGFKQWSAASRETEWSENTFYAIDALQAFTQLTSSILSRHSFSNSHCSGPAAITVLVANSMVTLNPIVRTKVGRMVARYQERHLNEVFPQEKPRTIDELTHDWKELDAVMSGDESAKKDATNLKQISFLIGQSQIMDNELGLETKTLERLRRVADQQAVAGPIIGLLSVARSTCAVVSYYGFRGTKLTANAVSFAGRVSQTVGQSYSLYATPRAKFKSILYQKRLAAQGKLPEQLYRERLKLLDDLEQKTMAAKIDRVSD